MSSDNPYPDLDPGMVEAAIVSGVDKSSLVSKGVNSLRWQTCKSAVRERGRGPRRSRRAWVCSNYILDPVAAALGKLTEVAGVLAEDRKKKSSVSKLEAALDSAHGGPKGSAAAWRALRMTLRPLSSRST